MKGLQDLMKQAQQLQARMAALQEELGRRTVEAAAGGGMVTVVVNGRQELVKLTIEPEVIIAEDRELLQDLVLAAVNEGLNRSRDLAQGEMRQLTGGLQVPGLT
jgi:DNA-binding YbaB/EbfC family protein